MIYVFLLLWYYKRMQKDEVTNVLHLPSPRLGTCQNNSPFYEDSIIYNKNLICIFITSLCHAVRISEYFLVANHCHWIRFLFFFSFFCFVLHKVTLIFNNKIVQVSYLKKKILIITFFLYLHSTLIIIYMFCFYCMNEH